MSIAYATREEVVSSLGFNESARLSAQVDRACQVGAGDIESLCHRVFYPTTAIKVFLGEDNDVRRQYLWLDNNELVSLTSVTNESGLVAASTYTLFPATGPPYMAIKFDGTAGSDDISVAGVFGYKDQQLSAGILAAAITTTTATTCDISDGSLVGVGDVLVIGTERLQVTGRTWLTSAQTGSLTLSNAAVTLAVANGAAFHTGEALLIESERLVITDIAGNNLTVKRAQEGTVLAAHVTATIYTSRTLTIVRGVSGSTAATHLISAVIAKQDYPSLVKSLNIALACNQLMQEAGGYSRDLGVGDARSPAPGGGLDALRHQVYSAYGRKVRMRVI